MDSEKILLCGGLMLTALGTPAVLSEAASAGEICNYENSVAYLARAYQNQDEVWISEGWWKLDPGQCAIAADNQLTYLMFDRDSEATRPYNQGFADTKLCIVHDHFIAYNAISTKACSHAGGTLKTFLGIGANREIIKD
jgi:uncharacterized membrane protein